MKKHPEELTFEKYQLDPIQATIHGVPYVQPILVEMRDYIIAHIDEDITPESVVKQFKGPGLYGIRSQFTCTMGESMPSMIRRLKQEKQNRESI